MTESPNEPGQPAPVGRQVCSRASVGRRGCTLRSAEVSGFARQWRQDSSAKGNALVTRPPIRFPALKGQNSDGCCPCRAKQCGLAEFPGRWPGLTSGCTFGAKAMVRMKQRSPITYQARADNRQKASGTDFLPFRFSIR
jgi:hypothetical protein